VVDEKDRGVAVFEVGDRRPHGVLGSVLLGEPPDLVHIEERDVACAERTHLIGDGGSDKRGLEPVRVTYGPTGHEASVRVTADEEAVSVGDAAPDEDIDAFHDVAEVVATPVADAGLAERLAVSGAAPRVREHYDVSLCGERLVLHEGSGTGVEAVWAAVDVDGEGATLSSLVVQWVKDERFDLKAILRLVREAPDVCKSNVTGEIVIGVAEVGFPTAILDRRTVHLPR
jgi:hypothetical protein